mmetsp:Transcript_21619/g.30226  ORF Transcript_21619/g.30226 Transcript_21619/m.30226 type:complete len:117 (-) Transcript_21619:11-361(-)
MSENKWFKLETFTSPKPTQPQFHSDFVKKRVEEYNVGKEQRAEERHREREREIQEDPELYAIYHQTRWGRFKSRFRGRRKCCTLEVKLAFWICLTLVILLLILGIIIAWNNKGLFM